VGLGFYDGIEEVACWAVRVLERLEVSILFILFYCFHFTLGVGGSLCGIFLEVGIVYGSA